MTDTESSGKRPSFQGKPPRAVPGGGRGVKQIAPVAGRRIKIGIDVGGTFTHAVAIDAGTVSLVGKAMVPTTHRAKDGVALGVVESMKRLIETTHLRRDEVALIAHSTTQATNALLEGDVATVGIIGMGKGIERFRAKGQVRLDEVELAPKKNLGIRFAFIDTGNTFDEHGVRAAIERLRNEGAEVFVASEAFGVDDPSHERRVAEIVRDMGYHCTVASEISQLYGLRVRTQTAAINASMLPKMLETADMTEAAVTSSGIASPLMIMRSDGGIMDVNEMRRRPILTMLSGPAAGVAAALMYVRISDGIFIEVGGTSTDISIIRRGRPLLKSAEVGGKKLALRTLDVRTVGVAGGSMVRLSKGRVLDVGPRSAHIAGLRYVSFASPDEIPEPELHLIQPTPSDPHDYCAISAHVGEEPRFALTTTDAANYLGFVKGDYAKGNPETVRKVVERISAALGTKPDNLCREILDSATDKVIDVVKRLVEEYKLDRRLLVLVGGGGGAEVITPYTAQRMEMKSAIAENAEVISAIGVALGLIQETVERNVVNPTESDVLRIRQEALDSVLRMGAAPGSIEVQVEIDSRTKRVRAVASGSSELRARDPGAQPLVPEQLASIAAGAFVTDEGSLRCAGRTKFLSAFQGTVTRRSLFGLARTTERPVVVLDRNGVVRLKLVSSDVHPAETGSVFELLGRIIEEGLAYGDAGALPPDVFLLVGGRVLDLTGLNNRDQILAVARTELQNMPSNEPLVLLTSPKKI